MRCFPVLAMSRVPALIFLGRDHVRHQWFDAQCYGSIVPVMAGARVLSSRRDGACGATDTKQVLY